MTDFISEFTIFLYEGAFAAPMIEEPEEEAVRHLEPIKDFDGYIPSPSAFLEKFEWRRICRNRCYQPGQVADRLKR
jgi:hypothetical protein